MFKLVQLDSMVLQLWVQRSDSFVRSDQIDSAQLKMPSGNSANSGVSINKSRLIAERDIQISGEAGKYQSVFNKEDLNPFGTYLFESDLDSGRLISVYGNAGSSYAGQTSLATGVHLLNANLSSFKIDLIGHGGDIFYTGQQATQLVWMAMKGF